jgi:hypothetical protein
MLGWRICLRLKASNCRVNEAALSVAVRISFAFLCNPPLKLRHRVDEELNVTDGTRTLYYRGRRTLE